MTGSFSSLRQSVSVVKTTTVLNYLTGVSRNQSLYSIKKVSHDSKGWFVFLYGALETCVCLWRPTNVISTSDWTSASQVSDRKQSERLVLNTIRTLCSHT